MNNIFKEIPSNIKTEVFQDIFKSENIRIERIISLGRDSNDGKWYNQDENEWVILLQGKADIIFENENINLIRGDYLFIEKHRKHKVIIQEENTETIWLAIFFK